MNANFTLIAYYQAGGRREKDYCTNSYPTSLAYLPLYDYIVSAVTVTNISDALAENLYESS